MTIGDSDSTVFCCKFDPTDKYLAVGYGDGICRIYNMQTQRLAFTLFGSGGNEEMPVSDIAWRP
jgi:WD40 repeat protein